MTAYSGGNQTVYNTIVSPARCCSLLLFHSCFWGFQTELIFQIIKQGNHHVLTDTDTDTGTGMSTRPNFLHLEYFKNWWSLFFLLGVLLSVRVVPASTFYPFLFSCWISVSQENLYYFDLVKVPSYYYVSNSNPIRNLTTEDRET